MIPYLTFVKHAELITKKVSAARPILSGVFHNEKGDLIVTDSHRLYLAKNSQSRKDNAVVNPKTGEEIDGSYPNVDRLVDMGNEKGSFYIEDLKGMCDAVKALIQAGMISKLGEKKLKKEQVLIRLRVGKENKVLLSSNRDSGIQSEYLLTFSDRMAEENTILFNAEYFLQALDLFRDVGYPAVEFKYYGQHRPFTISDANEDLIALILPVRENGEE